MAVLEAHLVTKSFVEGREQVPVLRGISLELERGEVAILEGPSGSGKTTLLFILGCLLTPTSGRVVVEGEQVDPRRPARLPGLRQRSIGFVFQQFNLFSALTAMENVEYALNIKGITGSSARREAGRLLEAVEMSDRRRARPRDLSGGQKQRVAIARALAGEAAIILADEPTANIDPRLAGRVLELFQRLAKDEDRAILIVSHDPKARVVADRVMQIQDGCLIE
ncbi:ABC transporter ATP-binding protein [Aquisphaera insulae]|uniref:ABC transporter ATP-binding protein n=1 Tax=Aquisphaera insulae TaxID=2712864 RepID=UPI0013ED642D|nr:ABC transporter ATP-binding protein [Aquisphaera insulae]